MEVPLADMNEELLEANAIVKYLTLVKNEIKVSEAIKNIEHNVTKYKRVTLYWEVIKLLYISKLAIVSQTK